MLKLHGLEGQEQEHGYPCTGIGVQIGKAMSTFEAKRCRLSLLWLMERHFNSSMLSLQLGGLDRHLLLEISSLNFNGKIYI